MNTLYYILNQRKYSQELRGDLISLPSRKLPLYLSLIQGVEKEIGPPCTKSGMLTTRCPIILA